MSDFEVIPQEAIDSLLASPEKAPAFDQVFGAGRAADVLASRSPAPAPVEVDEDLSLVGKVWDVIGRAPARGVQEAVNETADAYESYDQWMSQRLDKIIGFSGIQLFETDPEAPLGLGKFNPQLKTYEESAGDNRFLVGQVGTSGDAAEVNLVGETKTFTGGLVSGVAQFTAGFIGAGKLTRMSGLRGAFVNGAIADAVVFDPNDKNITALLQDYDIEMGAFTEALATNPDDPEYINRLRNAAEGTLAGAVAEAIGYSVRALRARQAGDEVAAQKFSEAQEEALGELDKAIREAGDEAVADARQSIDLSKEIFDDIEVNPQSTRVEPDGQLSLDLEDTPRAAAVDPDTAAANPNRFYMTPQKVEQARMQAALAQGAPRATKQAMYSFRSLTTVDDFDSVLDEIAGLKAVMADEFAKVKGGDTQRWATVKAQAAAKLRQMAEMTQEDPEALVRKFMKADLGDTAKIAAEVHARSRYVLSVEKELKEMAQAITNGSFEPKQFPGIRDMDHLKLAFTQRREVAANLLAGQDALRSNIARSMNAMKIAVKGDEQLREMLKDPSVFRDVEAAARAVADPANAGKSALRTIDETLKSIHGVMERINTFRINALLSGPGTQEVNMISNVVNSFVIPAEQFLGAGFSGDRRMAIHAVRQLQGYTAGLMDSVGAALQAGWHDDAILDTVTKIEDDALAGAITGIGAVDKAIKLPSRFLMTVDEFFKQSQYRGRVFADANEEAAQAGLKGQERTDFIKKYLEESYGSNGEAIRGDALLQARRATFTEPLEPGVASAIQSFAIKYPLIRFIIPFIRTPVNILSQTFQHVPLVGGLSKRWQADMAAGGARRAQALGRWVVGSGLIGMAGYMAASGQITGSGPSDPRIRKVWLQNNQPYAFRIDNEDGTTSWVSYARLEPLSNIFSIAADMVEISNDEYNENETRGIANALFMAVMENSVNKTFTQGIHDAMKIMSGQQHEREAAMRSYVASFVPNIANQLNGDEVLRETRTYSDAIMARLHKYNEVDPKRNVLGEPIIRRLPKYDPLGLSEDDRRETDTVLEEVTRVALLNQSVADNPARRLPGPNRIDLSTVPYSDTQSVYDRWIELTGTVKISGRTLREELERTFSSPAYRNAPDGFVGATSGTKGAIVRKVITAYRDKAKSELPELRELIMSERRLGADVLKSQSRQNRELFPTTTTQPERSLRRRTFEDLLGQ